MTVISMPARCMPMNVSIVGLSPPLVTQRDRIAMRPDRNTSLQSFRANTSAKELRLKSHFRALSAN